MTRMNARRAIQGLWLLSVATAFPTCGWAQVYDYQGPNQGLVANAREGMLRQSTSYRMFVPPGVKQLRGTIIWCCNNNGDDRRYANDPHWQAFATEMRMALMGTENKMGAAKTPYWAWQHDNHGSMAESITQAIAALGRQAGHPELAQLPITISGGSAGANFSVNLVGHLPQRFIGAAVTISEFGFGRHIEDNLRRGFPPPWDVPMLVQVGLQDPTQTAVPRALDSFALGKKRHAPWTLALHPRRGHVRCSEELLRTFLRAYIALRIDENHKPGQKLKKIDLTQGWLGHPETYEIAPHAEYRGDKQAAIWLPNQDAARAWQAFLKAP